MAKQSRSSKRSPTARGPSQTPSQTLPDLPETPAATGLQQDSLSNLSDEQLQTAISRGLLAARLDALSMIRRRAAAVRLARSQASQDSTSQQDMAEPSSNKQTT